MVGKKSGRAQLREEGLYTSSHCEGIRLTVFSGLERTDNNLELTTWPQVNMINQKNYYTEFLKREEQFLAFRPSLDENFERLVQKARDKDRALAFGTPAEGADQVEDGAVDDAAASSSQDNPTNLIVLHVGSQNLRIGFGTDALPKSVPMVIARRWKENESEENDGEPSPKRQKSGWSRFSFRLP